MCEKYKRLQNTKARCLRVTYSVWQIVGAGRRGGMVLSSAHDPQVLAGLALQGLSPGGELAGLLDHRRVRVRRGDGGLRDALPYRV